MIVPNVDDPECFTGEWRDDDSQIRVHYHVSETTSQLRSILILHPDHRVIQFMAGESKPCDWSAQSEGLNLVGYRR